MINVTIVFGAYMSCDFLFIFWLVYSGSKLLFYLKKLNDLFVSEIVQYSSCIIERVLAFEFFKRALIYIQIYLHSWLHK